MQTVIMILKATVIMGIKIADDVASLMSIATSIPVVIAR